MKKALFVCLCAVVAFVALGADYTPVTAEVGAVAIQTTATTNAVDSTEFTPVFVGQILAGSVSNDVYIAIGATTNDWVKISN